MFVIVMVIPFSVHGKGPLYSACHDWILLFQPLTTFVWSKCPCRPLTSLPVAQPPSLTCANRATRQKRLFCLFACRGTLICYDVSALSLFLSLMACTQWSQLIFASFGWYVILAGHFPQKSLSKNLKIVFPLSPPPDHTLLPLTHDLTTQGRSQEFLFGGAKCDANTFIKTTSTNIYIHIRVLFYYIYTLFI